MATELSKLRLIDKTYNLKDSEAREAINDLATTIDLSGYSEGSTIPEEIINKINNNYYKKAVYNNNILNIHKCNITAESPTIILENFDSNSTFDKLNVLSLSISKTDNNWVLEKINTSIYGSEKLTFTLEEIDNTQYITMGQLYSHWLENNTNKRYVIYDLHNYIDNGYICTIYFWHYNNIDFCQIQNLLTDKSYINYSGYTEDQLITDYVEKIKQGSIKIIKLASNETTLGTIKKLLDSINNNLVYKVLFDVSDLSASCYLVSINIDISNSKVNIFGLVTNTYCNLDYAEDKLLINVLAYLDRPINVVDKLPDTANPGQLAMLKGFSYEPITVITDLVIGQQYRLTVPSTVTTVPSSLLGKAVFMNRIANVETTIERNTAIPFTEDLSDYKPGLIATSTGKVMALAYTIDYVNNTYDGYDFTNGLGTSGLVVDFIYDGMLNMPTSLANGWISEYHEGARPTYLYRENKWNLLATSHEINAVYEALGTTIDLSGYKTNDQIPTETINELINKKYDILYNSFVYTLSEKASTDNYEYMTYIVPKSVENQAYYSAIVLYKDKTATTPIWIFSDQLEVHLGTYVNDVFNIILSDSKKFTIKYNDLETNIIQGDQTAEINLTLPSTSGILALTSDLDITSQKITTALGYTPYDATNPNGYISDYTVTSENVTDALGYVPYNSSNPNNYISKTDLTKSDIISKLGYTPYNETNPNHYISSYTVTNADVINALGYTPYANTNPNNYLSKITSSQITTALGYTPYNSTNPSNYISEITSANVTNALGYTPYNATNPTGYITASAHNLSNYYDKQYIDDLTSLSFEAVIVSVKPTNPISGKIYLIPVADTTDSYEEWMWVLEGETYGWKKLGTTSIDMADYVKTADLNSIAFTGSYSALVGAPTIPTTTSVLTNDSGFITKDNSELTHYTKTIDLAEVATSGNYTDLLNTPVIPTQTSQLTNDSGFVTNNLLSQTNVSTFINDGDGTHRYATLADIEILETLDPEQIQHAIDIAENVGSVTYVAGGTGLTGSGDKTITINHANSVTANTAYPTGTTLENGGSFTVRDVQYDDTGHVTNYQDRIITMTKIPSYDDTAVKSLITANETHINEVETDLNNQEAYLNPSVKFYTLSLLGTEPYIDPTTLQPVADRYYTTSDMIDATTEMLDNEKLDINLKAWVKYKLGWDTTEKLENCSFYVLSKNSNNRYINHLVNFWTAVTNTSISNYPNLCQVGCYCDDGYGSTPRLSPYSPGVLETVSQDGYIYATDSLGHAAVYGWGDLKNRVTAVEDSIGEINNILDSINGEVI